jgi:hypothetical protein
MRKGQQTGQDIIRSELAPLIISTLEGSLLLSRLQREEGARALVCDHLEGYLETSVRANQLRSG